MTDDERERLQARLAELDESTRHWSADAAIAEHTADLNREIVMALLIAMALLM